MRRYLPAAVMDYDEVAVEVAARSRRSLEGIENNPTFNQIETVRDLVEFFWAQPKLTDPPQPPTIRNGWRGR